MEEDLQTLERSKSGALWEALIASMGGAAVGNNTRDVQLPLGESVLPNVGGRCSAHTAELCAGIARVGWQTAVYWSDFVLRIWALLKQNPGRVAALAICTSKSPEVILTVSRREGGVFYQRGKPKQIWESLEL